MYKSVSPTTLNDSTACHMGCGLKSSVNCIIKKSWSCCFYLQTY